MNRLHNLDYLRGITAFCIMIFHYLSWTLGEFNSDSFLGRLGIYGVSIFYVLSGLTLFHVYYNKMLPSKVDIITFIKKRIFRIFPLLWIVTIISILMYSQAPDIYSLVLNLTGLFGFFKWDTYFSTGVWSIGNELVFYAFFPFFVYTAKKSNLLFLFISIIIFCLYLYFAFIKLNPYLSLNEQWGNYVNPLNQVFLFLGGFAIGFYFQKRNVTNALNMTLLVMSLCLFIYYPVEGNPIHLVTGINRLVFSFCCFLICFCYYKLKFELPVILHKSFSLLGEASYSVYLLHPLLYSLIGFILKISDKYFFHFSESVRLILSVTSTLTISYFVYQYIEKYFMKLGRNEYKVR